MQHDKEIKKKRKINSGLGWIFIVLLLVFLVAYAILLELLITSILVYLLNRILIPPPNLSYRQVVSVISPIVFLSVIPVLHFTEYITFSQYLYFYFEVDTIIPDYFGNEWYFWNLFIWSFIIFVPLISLLGEIIPDEPIFDYLDSIKLGSSLGIVGLIAYIVLIYFGVIIQPENKLIETIIDMIKGCGYNC